MTESTVTSDHQAAHDDHDNHPTEAQYWYVFVGLVILTAIEVAWFYLPVSGAAETIPLIVMMVVKFLIVAGAFMHLYFDFKTLNGRVFAWAFAGAMALAFLVYLILLATFEFAI